MVHKTGSLINYIFSVSSSFHTTFPLFMCCIREGCQCFQRSVFLTSPHPRLAVLLTHSQVTDNHRIPLEFVQSNAEVCTAMLKLAPFRRSHAGTSSAINEFLAGVDTKVEVQNDGELKV